MSVEFMKELTLKRIPVNISCVGRPTVILVGFEDVKGPISEKPHTWEAV